LIEHRKTGIAKTFSESIRNSLTSNPSIAEQVLKAYSISADLTDRVAFHSILKFAADICFFAPALAFAKGWPGKAFLYHFNEPNPWDGEWKGEATHVLDVAFLLQNFNEFLSSAQRDSATAFAGDIIKFINGKAPWPVFEQTKPVSRFYGPSTRKGSEARAAYMGGICEGNTGRRSTILHLSELVDLDILTVAWHNFVAGK
jgi:hypothetical protein